MKDPMICAKKVFSKFRIFLALSYLIGFILHLLDVMGLRLNIAELDTVWKSWIIFLLVLDLLVAVGLLLKKIWGEVLFLTVALSQLIAYIGFSSFFGDQVFLINFHLVCIFLYIYLKILSSTEVNFRKKTK